MPLKLGDYFDNRESKVIEILPEEIDGNYRLERYKLLNVYSGIWSAYIFFVDEKEYHRDTRVGLMHMLISWHMKVEVLGLFPIGPKDVKPSF
jgi:hypothetical protein